MAKYSARKDEEEKKKQGEKIKLQPSVTGEAMEWAKKFAEETSKKKKAYTPEIDQGTVTNVKKNAAGETVFSAPGMENLGPRAAQYVQNVALAGNKKAQDAFAKSYESAQDDAQQQAARERLEQAKKERDENSGLKGVAKKLSGAKDAVNEWFSGRNKGGAVWNTQGEAYTIENGRAAPINEENPERTTKTGEWQGPKEREIPSFADAMQDEAFMRAFIEKKAAGTDADGKPEDLFDEAVQKSLMQKALESGEYQEFIKEELAKGKAPKEAQGPMPAPMLGAEEDNKRPRLIDTIIAKYGAPEAKPGMGITGESGSVDLTGDLGKAWFEYKEAGRFDELSPETQRMLSELYAEDGVKAWMGVLGDKEFSQFALTDKDGNTAFELNNVPAEYLYTENSGKLGASLMKIASMIYDDEFPAELRANAFMAGIQLIQEANDWAKSDAFAREVGAENADLVNIYDEYQRLHGSESVAARALNDAIILSADMKRQAEEAKKLAEEEAQRTEWEMLLTARDKIRSGKPYTQEDIDLVEKYAPVMDEASRMADPLYKDLFSQMEDEWFFDNTGWMDEQVLSMAEALGGEYTAQTDMDWAARVVAHGFLEDVLRKKVDVAYALGYQNLEEYARAHGGITLDSLHTEARLEMLKLGSAMDSVDMAISNEAVKYAASGKGVTAGDIAAAAGASGVLSAVGDPIEAFYNWMAATDLKRDGARVKATYDNDYGLYSETQLIADLNAMADGGYFPSEEMAMFVKEYLKAGGNPYELGLMPDDLQFVRKSVVAIKQTRKAYGRWAQRILNPAQGMAFEAGSAISDNVTRMVLGGLVGGATGSSFVGTLVSFGSASYNEGAGMIYAADAQEISETGNIPKNTQRWAHVMGTAQAAATAVSEYMTFGKWADDVGRLFSVNSAVRMGMNDIGVPGVSRVWAGAAKFFKSLAKQEFDEVFVDELKEGLLSLAAENSVLSLRESAGTPMNALLSSVCGTMNAILNADDILQSTFDNAGMMAFTVLPTAILGAGGAMKEALPKSYAASKQLKNSGKGEDAGALIKTVLEETASATPEQMEAANGALHDAAVAEDAIVVLTSDAEIEPTNTVGTKAQEQADAHADGEANSRQAAEDGLASAKQAQERMNAGELNPELVTQIANGVQAHAKNSQGVIEHQREKEQKQAEADKAFSEGMKKATAKAEAEVTQREDELRASSETARQIAEIDSRLTEIENELGSQEKDGFVELTASNSKLMRERKDLVERRKLLMSQNAQLNADVNREAQIRARLARINEASAAADEEGVEIVVSQELSDEIESLYDELSEIEQRRNQAATPRIDETAVKAQREEAEAALAKKDSEASAYMAEQAEREKVQQATLDSMDGVRVTPTPTVGRARQNAARTYKRLAKTLGVGQTFGTRKMNGLEGRAAGYYEPRAGYVASSTNYASSIEVDAHELGHAIAHRLGITGTDDMVNNLTAGFHANYSPSDLPGEAFAEFFWRYMLNDEEARRFAGDAFIASFERRMRQDGILRDVKRAQIETRRYMLSEANERIGLMIRDKSDKSKDNTLRENFEELERSFISRLVDSTRPAEDVNAAVREAAGGNIQERMNLRNAALMQSTAPRRSWHILMRGLTDVDGTIVGESLRDRFARTGIRGDQFETLIEYMLAKHSLDRDAQNKPVFDRSAISQQDTRAFIDEIERDHPEIVAAERAFQEFRHDFMTEYMVRTGYMRAEDLDFFETMYPHYVPTYRVKERGRKGVGGQTYEVRRASGSTEEIINPMDSFVDMVNTIVAMNLRNETAKTWDRVYRTYDGMGVFGREVTEDQRVRIMDMRSVQESVRQMLEDENTDNDVIQRVLDAIGEEQIRRSGTGDVNLPNILTVQMPDGSQRFYEMFDNELFEMFAGTQDSGKSALSILGTLTRSMSMLTTGSNPLFFMRNALRDFQNSVNYGSWASNYMTGGARWLRAAWEVWRESGEYEQYRALGGGGWTRADTKSRKSAEEYRSELFRGYNTSNIGRSAKWAGRKIWNIVTASGLNELVEQASRYAEYRYGKHDRSTPEGRREAYLAAQEVTTDFNRKGNALAAREARMLVPFLNASLQGVYRTGRQFTEAERDRAATRFVKTVINTGLASALASAWMIQSLDEDEQEEFFWLSDDLKAKHMYIPNFAPDVLGEAPLIRIPLNQDPLAYAIHGAVTNAMWSGEGEEWAIGICAIADNIMNSINPVGSTILDPIISTMTNRNWYGSNIVPRRMEGWEPTTQYTEETPDAFIEASRLLDAATGLAMSPMMLQYIAEQYTGFVGQIAIPFMTKDANTGEIGGIQAVIQKARNTLTSDPLKSNDVVSCVYDNEEFLTYLTKAQKNGRAMSMLRNDLTQREATRAANEAYDLTHKGGAIYDAKKIIDSGYDEIEEIEANDTLTDDQKYELIGRVRREMIEAALDANEEMQAFREMYVTGESFLTRFMRAPIAD